MQGFRFPYWSLSNKLCFAQKRLKTRQSTLSPSADTGGNLSTTGLRPFGIKNYNRCNHNQQSNQLKGQEEQNPFEIKEIRWVVTCNKVKKEKLPAMHGFSTTHRLWHRLSRLVVWCPRGYFPMFQNKHFWEGINHPFIKSAASLQSARDLCHLWTIWGHYECGEKHPLQRHGAVPDREEDSELADQTTRPCQPVGLFIPRTIICTRTAQCHWQGDPEEAGCVMLPWWRKNVFK